LTPPVSGMWSAVFCNRQLIFFVTSTELTTK